MNKKVVKPIILVIVFIGALITFSIITNKEYEKRTTTMAEATLPIVNFVYMDTEMNELHGYVNEMDLRTMREAVTPVDSENKLHMEITACEEKIDNISYEIRSVDDNRLLVDNDKAEHIIDGEKIICDIFLPSLFEKYEEYNMVISLTIGEEKVHYYTRLMKEEGTDVKDSLAFALQFHEYTFREDADTFITTYMEPATGDATKLSYVDLTCTLKQITWADFEGVRLTEPTAYLEEVNDSYNVIVLKYVMTNVNENGEAEYYNVEEYYRLRNAADRMYVLNFERRMNQIFRADSSFIRNDSAIVLGIRDDNVEYVSNEAGDSIAFVQEGELWSYNRTNNTISQVFSFRGLEGISTKENWNQHDIKIIKVDEAGSIDFAVYGYMNRGEHEGEVGIGVYHYDGIVHTVEEGVFISSVKSYDALKTELGDLLYVNEQEIMYLMLNDTVYKINLATYEAEVELGELKDTRYAVSESNRFLTWVDEELSQVIHLADLKTGITYEVKEDGVYLRPLAFLGEDFVYGIANADDVSEDVIGNIIFPMSSLKIMNAYEGQKEIIKEYVPISGFIKEIELEDSNIYVTLMKANGGVYAESGNDIIMNREAEVTGNVEISTMVTEKKQTQILLSMETLTTKETVKMISAQYTLLEEEREKISLDTFSENVYYVYVRGEAVFASKDVSEAILAANKDYGIVVDGECDYIWKRARAGTKSAFKNLMYNEVDAAGDSVVKSLSTILMYEGKGISVIELVNTGKKPKDILQSTLPDCTVLELYGCNSDELLYFISNGTPVMAYVENGQAILLTGYSSSQLYFYDPVTGTEGSRDFKEADEWFALGGQRFIVYVK